MAIEYQTRYANVSDANEIFNVIKITGKNFDLADLDESVRKHFLGIVKQYITDNIGKNIDYLLAEKDNKIIGLIGISKSNHLTHLFVLKKYHRQGIAQDLWTTSIEARIKQNNTADVSVNSSLFAVDVYRKFGFIENGPQTQKEGIPIQAMIYKFSSNE